MDRKGFTIIELLATILILALIMLIAVPNVMSIIDRNKQDTYVSDAKKMITLAEYEIRSNTSIELPTDGNCIVILLRTLDTSEFTEAPEGGDYDLDKSYVVVARLGNSYEYFSTIVENYDGNTRGIPLTARSDLNKENARNKVTTGSDLDIEIPAVGGELSGYSITNIY